MTRTHVGIVKARADRTCSFCKNTIHSGTYYIEFEEHSGNFKEQKHDPNKCDLIVCAHHDWEERFPNEKCPLPVYVVGEVKQKFFPACGESLIVIK